MKQLDQLKRSTKMVKMDYQLGREYNLISNEKNNILQKMENKKKQKRFLSNLKQCKVVNQKIEKKIQMKLIGK
jgi:hypothetical protein